MKGQKKAVTSIRDWTSKGTFGFKSMYSLNPSCILLSSAFRLVYELALVYREMTYNVSFAYFI